MSISNLKINTDTASRPLGFSEENVTSLRLVMPTATDATVYKPSKPAQLVLQQFKTCGLIYTSKKYLVIALLLKLSVHLKVTSSLLLPNTKSLVKHYPTQPFKYLHRYLATSFNISSRSIILANHYNFLNKVVAFDFIDRICEKSILLWEEEIEENLYAIDMSYPKNEEGELLLSFSENTVRLFTLTFTIAPGNLLNLANEQVVFIGRLQGGADKRDAIKNASKEFCDITPAALLLAAVRGIATSLNIATIVGVSAQNQISKGKTPCAHSSKAAYDEFFISAGGQPLHDGFYYLSVMPDDKPLSSVKNNHRSRVKRKRQIRNTLIEQVSMTFSKTCLSLKQANTIRFH